MIIVFGSISTDLYFEVERLPETNEIISAAHCDICPGGKGANQALAAARSGARVSLVGKIGDDKFGENILDALHREDITASGVTQSTLPTGTVAYITDGSGLKHTIVAPGANADASADQIPKEILDKKALLLLQTEIDPQKNLDSLEKAKKAGALTMMNLSPSIDLTQKALNHLDYLVVNQVEARRLAEKLGLKVEDNALKMAHGLSSQGKLNCIITIGARGCVAVTKEGTGWSIEALPVEKIIDRSGAEDSYCGTLAACIQAGLPLPRAMKRASIAGSLTCTQKGRQNTFPSLDSIDKRINDISDPVQHDL